MISGYYVMLKYKSCRTPDSQLPTPTIPQKSLSSPRKPKSAKMKRLALVFAAVLMLSANSLLAQTTENDMPVNQLPDTVKAILDQYIRVLNSPTLNECAEQFLKIAGGDLVNDDASALASSVKDMSLKKDYNDIKHYQQPVVITRISKTYSNGLGYGVAATKGYVYKIWIQKIDATLGMPAPVSILLPDEGQYVKSPKVIGIGSF
jgi:hypothetical protein